MEAGMYDKILADGFNGEIKYKPGFGPVTARVIDPLTVKDGKYKLDIAGPFNLSLIHI